MKTLHRATSVDFLLSLPDKKLEENFNNSMNVSDIRAHLKQIKTEGLKFIVLCDNPGPDGQCLGH